MSKCLTTAAIVFSLLLLAAPDSHAAKVLELKSANYDPNAGVWSDTSGNGNDAVAGNAPALVPGQTPNGSAVVRFSGNNFLNLTSGISSAAFTCVAYVRPTSGDSRTIVGGETASFQYRIGGDGFGDKQEVLLRNLTRLGESNSDVSTSDFSTISVTIGGGGTFRLNQANDGGPRSQFPSPTNLVGAASGPNEFYSGDIAEIRIYDTVLSDAERTAVEEEIRQTYEGGGLTAVPSARSFVLAGLGVVGLLGYAWRRRRRVL